MSPGLAAYPPGAIERFTVEDRPEPGYLRLYRNGELKRRVRLAVAELESCSVCPRDCRVDRLHEVAPEENFGVMLEAEHLAGQPPRRRFPEHIAKGTSCFTGRHARVSCAFPHFGEEDCLRGWSGSGTIFFSFCNLRCVFCQNWDVSQAGEGREACPEELAALMLELQRQGCHNINLVTPEHVVPHVLEGVLLAAEAGLRLPLVYNTSGYDSMRSLEVLDGVVDIYMPDFKYWDPAKAKRYLKAEDYPEVARRTITEMHRQVGPLRFDRDGLAVRGLFLRHLVMPGGLDDSQQIFRFLAREVCPDTYVNVMEQYRPAGGLTAERYPELCRRPSAKEILTARQLAEAEGLSRFDTPWGK